MREANGVWATPPTFDVLLDTLVLHTASLTECVSSLQTTGHPSWNLSYHLSPKIEMQLQWQNDLETCRLVCEKKQFSVKPSLSSEGDRFGKGTESLF